MIYEKQEEIIDDRKEPDQNICECNVSKKSGHHYQTLYGFYGDSLFVEIDGLLYNGTINCMFDTGSFPGIV